MNVPLVLRHLFACTAPTQSNRYYYVLGIESFNESQGGQALLSGIQRSKTNITGSIIKHPGPGLGGLQYRSLNNAALYRVLNVDVWMK